MVHHLVIYKLEPAVTDDKLEEMIRTSRSQLLKIPEVLNIRSGRNIEKDSPWPFFVSMDFESMDKLAMCQDDPIYAKFIAEVLEPNTSEALSLDYEMEPGKDIKYS
ncbi:MAG: Dabb family protein [Verrucomicrobiales bacterium]